MKTMDELNQLLCQQAPSDPLVKLLNDTFGPLGWEFDGSLKVNVKVNEGHFLSVSRWAEGRSLAAAARMFGLEVKNESTKETPVPSGPGVVPASSQLGGVQSGVGEAVPGAPPKPKRETILKSISTLAQIVIAKKLKTQDELTALVGAMGAKRKEELSDDQALKLLEQLQEVVK